MNRNNTFLIKKTGFNWIIKGHWYINLVLSRVQIVLAKKILFTKIMPKGTII